jgi:hypothetical protein
MLENNPSASYPLATQDDLDETVTLVEKTCRRCLAHKADSRDRTDLTEKPLNLNREFHDG